MYVIQHGIPVQPSKRGHFRRGAVGNYTSELSMVMTDMPVGSSFLVRTERERADAARRTSLFKVKGMRFAIRKIDGQGWRIWRIE